jgi:two-component system, response regulator YesN
MDNPRKYRAIVAEDEPMIREGLCRDIAEAHPGFVVAGEAHNGRAALDLAEELSPDLLVTDIRMPVMDGLELIERCYRFHPAMALIIVSGYGDFAYAKTAIRFGVSDYLLKPVEEPDLAAALARAYLRLSKEEENFASPLGDTLEAGARGRMVEMVAELLRGRFREHPSINALAESFHVSPAYLTRAFKESLGVSPGRYALDLRMGAARKMLEEKGAKEIKEIAAELGYSDQCYFSRAFRRIVGLSPLEYRAVRFSALPCAAPAEDEGADASV